MMWRGQDRQREPVCLLPAVVGLGLLLFLGASLRRDYTGSAMSSLDKAEERRAPVLRIKSEIGDGLYPHENLVEVYQRTTLAVDEDAAVWTLTGADVVTGRGAEIDVEFQSQGRHTVEVTIDDKTTSFVVTAKYVRREIRDLKEDDRKRYFDAVEILYRTDQETGFRKYGKNFRSAAWLIREHLYGAAQRTCDHWHDDAGFLNHHVGVTMQFEQSIQSVDPRVASHYWDYTADAALGDDWNASIIFSDDWFGSADPGGDDHVITKGRWAWTPVERIRPDGKFTSNITNPYGLLRSPWNTNPIPYLMRSRYTMGVRDALYHLPTCADFQKVLETKNLSFAYLSSELNGGLHGEVHIMLGGHWWTTSEFATKMADHVSLMRSSPHISDQLLLGSKFLWRQGIIHCPTTCDETEDCACHCPDSALQGRSAQDIFHLTGLLAIVPEFESVLIHQAGFTYDDLLNEMCHVGHPGEMFTSAAPQDPIFWPLHGLSERFVQLIRILAARNILSFDESWGYNHIPKVLSDTNVVCDWSSAGDHPVCVRNTTCPGHRADDLLPFTDLSWAPETSFTNVEFFSAIDPSNTDLPYVYDNLATWPACPDRSLLSPQWREALFSSES